MPVQVPLLMQHWSCDTANMNCNLQIITIVGHAGPLRHLSLLCVLRHLVPAWRQQQQACRLLWRP